MSTQRLIVGNSGTQNINLATANTITLNATTAVNVSSVLRSGAGASNIPSYSFTGDPDTGMFNIFPGGLGFSTDAGTRLTISNGNTVSATPFLLPDGTAGVPSLSYSNDSDTGVYRAGINNIGFSTGGINRANITDSAITTTVPIQPTFVHPSAGTALAPTHSFSTDTSTGIYSGGANVLSVAVGGTNTVNFTTTEINPATDNAISLGNQSFRFANGIFAGVLLSSNRPRLVFNMMAPSATTALTGAIAYSAGQSQYPTASLGSVSSPLNFPGGAWGVFGNPGSNFYITFTNTELFARTIHIDWSLTIQTSVNLGFYSPYLYRSTTAPPFATPLTFTNLWDNTQDPQLIKVVGANQNTDRGSHNLSGLMFVPVNSTLYIPLVIANGANAQNITLLSMNGSAYVID